MLKTLPNDIHAAAQLLRELANEYRISRNITFEEEKHKYTMKYNGIDYSDKLMSTSKAYKKFKLPFDSISHSLRICKGDAELAMELRDKWTAKGIRSSTMGSYCHYHLEQYICELHKHKDPSEIRMPDIGNPDDYLSDAISMIEHGKSFVNWANKIGAVIIDTEAVMGCEEYELFGQADKFWLVRSKSGIIGLLTTDWKTNEPNKFDVKYFTKNMLGPYQMLHDNAFGEYSVQLTMYSALFIKMINKMGYDLPYIGSIIVNLTPYYNLQYRVESGIYGVTKSVLENKLHLQQWFDPKLYNQ